MTNRFSLKIVLDSSRQDRTSFRCDAGFTLLELVIVVLLIGILSVVALPSYTNYIVKSNRADAKDKLTEIMFEQERHQLRQRSYTLNLNDLGYDAEGARGVRSNHGHYFITARPCVNNRSLINCVLLEARPVPGGVQQKAGEVPLKLNSIGEQFGPWH